MTTIEITPERLTVVKHLATGKSVDVVSTITRLPKHRVLDIGSHHGYPDTDKLGKAAELMQARLDRDATTLPERAPDPAPQTSRPTTSTPVGRETTPLTKPDEIRVLLNTAKAHPSKRIQNAANRVFDQLGRLREALAEDERKNSEKRKAAEQKAAARAEVERLEQQLREAKAKLRGAPAAEPKKERKSSAPRGEYPCRNPGCDDVKDTPQGRSMHERFHCQHRPDAK